MKVHLPELGIVNLPRVLVLRKPKPQQPKAVKIVVWSDVKAKLNVVGKDFQDKTCKSIAVKLNAATPEKDGRRVVEAFGAKIIANKNGSITVR